MINLKKTLAAFAAFAVLHLSLLPASAAIEDFKPGMGLPVSVGAVAIPTLPATLPGALAPSAIPQLPAPAAAPLPGAVLNVPVAPAASPAVGAASAPQAPASRAALEGMGSELSGLNPDNALAASSALGRGFDASRRLPAAEAVDAAVPSSIPTGLLPARPAAPRPESPAAARLARLRSSQAGKANVALIAVIGGLALVITLVVGLVIHSGHKQNAKWTASPAHADVVAVEKARAAGDTQALSQLAQKARARQAGESGPDAAFNATADGLAAMRAEEALNAISTDPKLRLGGELPETWRGRLDQAKTASAQAGTIKPLAVALDGLDNELQAEEKTADRFSKDLDKFHGEVPSFGGEMGQQYDAAQKELAEFNAEVAAEKGLWSSYNGAERDLVSDRLQQQDPRFRAVSSHKARIADYLSARPIASVQTIADSINKDLQDMADHRRKQQDALNEAPKHTADPVKDQNGNPVKDQNGNPVTVDNSKQYTDTATAEAKYARDSAQSARSHIEDLNAALAALRKSQVLKDEGLSNALPASAASSNMSLPSGTYYDLLNPDDLNWHAGDFTADQARDAQVRFATVSGAIGSVETSLEGRVTQDQATLNGMIDDEVKAEKAKSW